MTHDTVAPTGLSREAKSLRLHVGTDVGGTFTDLWVITDNGEQFVVKSPSTPDIISGILGAIDLAAARLGVDAQTFCSSVERFGHGTTAGLNALLTGRSAKTAIITTDGFRDTLEIGRLKRQVAGLTDLQLGDYVNRGRWAPVVPRHLVFEVTERIDRQGDVVVDLDEPSVHHALERIADQGVEAIAVCTLWSVVNPAHERRIAELVRERFPHMFVSLSHEVAPGTGEFARMSTTATNAALGPIMGTYLQNLDAALKATGLTVPVQVMTGVGGVMPAHRLVREPMAAMMSGPAAGVIACQQLGRKLDIDRLLTIDVGGTSFDVGVVVDGTPMMRNQVSVAGADIHRPAIDVGTIGAGGGSIARVEHGVLRVGPQSAGSTPGPVCYGRGGELVTATDADLVLGVFAEEGFAGGHMTLSKAAAEVAIEEQIAEPLGMTLLEAAWGVRQVLDSKMADLLRSVTIERGHDPREFVMFANGGQGPSHAWALSRELGISTYIVTPTATAQSALGTGTSDLRQTSERPCFVRIPPGRSITQEDLDRINAELRDAEAHARSSVLDDMENMAVQEVSVDLTLALRYRGQAHHLDVLFNGGQMDEHDFEGVVSAFEQQYESLFGAGSAFREAGLEVLNVRALLTARLEAASAPDPRGDLVESGTRAVVFDDPAAPVACPVYQTEFPSEGHKLRGPALVVYPGQTLVIPPDATAHTDKYGNFIVHVDTPDAAQTDRGQ
jgi:N-methylhydantoinase A